MAPLPSRGMGLWPTGPFPAREALFSPRPARHSAPGILAPAATPPAVFGSTERPNRQDSGWTGNGAGRGGKGTRHAGS